MAGHATITVPAAAVGETAPTSPTLTALRGLPGSGKSTLAGRLRAETRAAGRRCVVIGRDAIRDWGAIGWHDGADAERLVTAIQHAAIAAALADGADVVVDDTNLSAPAIPGLAELARRAGAHLVVRDIDTDVETCIRRDAARPAPSPGGPVTGRRVGAEVIRMLAARRS